MLLEEKRFLRLREVQSRIGLARATIYLKIKNNEFPRPYPLGARAVAWLSTEIDEWISKKITISNVTEEKEKNL